MKTILLRNNCASNLSLEEINDINGVPVMLTPKDMEGYERECPAAVLNHPSVKRLRASSPGALSVLEVVVKVEVTSETSLDILPAISVMNPASIDKFEMPMPPIETTVGAGVVNVGGIVFVDTVTNDPPAQTQTSTPRNLTITINDAVTVDDNMPIDPKAKSFKGRKKS